MTTLLGQHEELMSSTSVQEREGASGLTPLRMVLTRTTNGTDIIHALLASLPRSRLAGIQRKLTPMLLLDVVGVRCVQILTPPRD